MCRTGINSMLRLGLDFPCSESRHWRSLDDVWQQSYEGQVSRSQALCSGRNRLNTGSGASDYKAAIELLKQASILGHVEAQAWPGAVYDYGLGTKQNRRVALKHYQIAADAGNANAQYHVGVFYHDGTGVRRNYPTAVPWLRKAVRQGDAEQCICSASATAMDV